MAANPLLTTPREFVVVILPGDVDQRVADLNQKVAEAELEALEAGPLRLADRDEPPAAAVEAAEEIDRIVYEAEHERAVRIRLRGIGGSAYDELAEQHPARKGDETDGIVGANASTFLPELVRLSIVDPVVTAEQFEEFWDQASKPNQNRLKNAAYELATGVQELPKSLAVSLLRRLHATEQKRQGVTESARDGSTGGSLRRLSGG